MSILEAKNKEQFIEFIKKDKCMILIHANWCEPCNKLKSNLDSITEEIPDMTIVKVDVNDLDDIAYTFKVTKIPHIAFLKNGELQRDHFSGINDHNAICETAKEIFS